MERKRRGIWLVVWGVVVIFFVALFPKNWVLKKNRVNSSSLPEIPETVTQQLTSSLELEEEDLTLDWGRDPFVIGEMTSTRSGNRLTGIIFDERQLDQSYAIIDEELVKAGDQISGSKVIQIERNKVILETDGNKEELFLE